jgi:hypothetical protein
MADTDIDAVRKQKKTYTWSSTSIIKDGKYTFTFFKSTTVANVLHRHEHFSNSGIIRTAKMSFVLLCFSPVLHHLTLSWPAGLVCPNDHKRVKLGARDGVIGWGTALQAGRSRVRLPMGPLEFFIDPILRNAVDSACRGSNRCVDLTTLSGNSRSLILLEP